MPGAHTLHSHTNVPLHSGLCAHWQRAHSVCVSIPQAWATLSDCSLVAGLHPDGAAEGIVDYALRHHKPFAIVPCCICAPTPKMSHPRFIEYLVAKAPERIRTCVLPFEGKNICVYSVPDETDVEV